jgi:UDP-GlcNAc:undecaprenyl-phosphate GlcNAc-1-phosphate transferase
LIPHLGGISIVLGTFLAMLLHSTAFGSRFPLAELMSLWKVLPGVSLLVVLGLVDDMTSLKVFQKLVVQIIASLLLVASGFSLLLGLPGFDQIALLSMMFTVIYLVGISSAVNLIDGLDGLAGGLCFIASTAFAIISSMIGAYSLLTVSLALGASCLAFLVYNFPPGKIFMGDTGSLFLGVVLGLVAISLSMLKPGAGTFFGVCFVLGVPIMDALLAIFRRLFLNKHIFKADALHMHHVLISFGFSPRQTLLVLYSVGAVLAVLGVFAIKGYLLPIITGSFFFIAMSICFFKLMIAEGRREREAADALARNAIPALESEAVVSRSSR